MKKKLLIGLMASLLVAGMAGCSSDNQSTAKKASSNNMNMTPTQMNNMKSSDKK